MSDAVFIDTLLSSTQVLPVISVLIGARVILLVILSLLVTARRAVLGGIQFGDVDGTELRHRIRAHGNFIQT